MSPNEKMCGSGNSEKRGTCGSDNVEKRRGMCGDKRQKILEEMSSKLGFTPGILETLKELEPEFMDKYSMCNSGILQDGALPAKTKILMALAVVASKQCEACVASQMKSAINHGATKEEIMEVMEVIFITSGAPAVAACRHALKTLQ